MFDKRAWSFKFHPSGGRISCELLLRGQPGDDSERLAGRWSSRPVDCRMGSLQLQTLHRISQALFSHVPYGHRYSYIDRVPLCPQQYS